jgi:hypothetical protein
MFLTKCHEYFAPAMKMEVPISAETGTGFS